MTSPSIVRRAVKVTRVRIMSLYDVNPATGLFIAKQSRGCIKRGNIAKAHHTHGYVSISIDNKDYLAHRLMWFVVHKRWPSKSIDHINGITDDNRIINLRMATPSQNLSNAKMPNTNTSGFKGVSWHRKCRKWQAHIRYHKTIYLGLFKTPQDAHAAYTIAAHRYKGEFARVK